MNPPFDRGRDCDHVRHALAFLKPGGVLVAIMSARAEYGEDQRHKELHRMIAGCEAIYFHGRKWIDLPPGSFRSAEHTSELQSLMRISYAVICLNTTQTT